MSPFDLPTTETIIDADGLDAEAFARLYRAWVHCDLIFGSVPCEVDADDGTLTVTIHDPVETVQTEDDVRAIASAEVDKLRDELGSRR